MPYNKRIVCFLRSEASWGFVSNLVNLIREWTGVISGSLVKSSFVGVLRVMFEVLQIVGIMVPCKLYLLVWIYEPCRWLLLLFGKCEGFFWKIDQYASVPSVLMLQAVFSLLMPVAYDTHLKGYFKASSRKV